MSDDRIIKTYVWHKDQCFFVSTIECDSSAMLGPERYNETLVWEYDWEKRARDEHFIYQGGTMKGSIYLHQRVVELLFTTGKPEEDEKDDNL